MLFEKLLLMWTTRVEAADAGTIATGLQGNPLMPTTLTDMTMKGLLTTAIQWLVWIAGILAFFYLVYSGILYVTAAGNPDQAKKGQQGLINAVIGIIVIVMAWVILKAISSEAATPSFGAGAV